MKAKREHRAPLSDRALMTLNEAQSIRGGRRRILMPQWSDYLTRTANGT